MSTQKFINSFKRKYLVLTKLPPPNHIIHDPNTTPNHRKIVNEVCEWALQNKKTFYTRAKTKWGEIVDIVIPELPTPFIEVRHSEKEKKKNYTMEYDGEEIWKKRKFIDTDDPWGLL